MGSLAVDATAASGGTLQYLDTGGLTTICSPESKVMKSIRVGSKSNWFGGDIAIQQ